VGGNLSVSETGRTDVHDPVPDAVLSARLLGGTTVGNDLLFEPRQVTDLSAVVLASITYQGIIVAFASYLVWFWLIQVYPVSNISGFTFFTPIFGILLGGVLLQEPLTVKLLVGGGLVTGGMVLVNWPER